MVKTLSLAFTLFRMTAVQSTCRLIILVFLFFLLTACSGKRLNFYVENIDSYDQVAYVVDHDYHTALVVDAVPLATRLGLSDTLFSRFNYIEVGRGDAGYYQAEGEVVSVALKALFLSTPAVLHLSAYNKPPAEKFLLSKAVEIRLSKAAMDKLYDAIVSDFSFEQGRAIELAIGRDKNSRFFKSKGSYHLFYTCNNWTADVIQQAGYPINHRWSFFSGSVMSQLDDVQQSLSSVQNKPDQKLSLVKSKSLQEQRWQKHSNSVITRR